MKISKTFWGCPVYMFPGRVDFKNSFWYLKVWVLAFWANSCCFVSCPPVLSISSQMAALCDPPRHFGWWASVAPEAVAILNLGADLCALLCAFHIRGLNTRPAYFHVLLQLTSVDRNWKNASFRCECLFWLQYLLQLPLTEDRQGQELTRMSSRNLWVLNEPDLAESSVQLCILSRYSFRSAYNQQINMFVIKTTTGIHVHLVTLIQIYISKCCQ